MGALFNVCELCIMYGIFFEFAMQSYVGFWMAGGIVRGRFFKRLGYLAKLLFGLN